MPARLLSAIVDLHSLYTVCSARWHDNCIIDIDIRTRLRCLDLGVDAEIGCYADMLLVLRASIDVYSGTCCTINYIVYEVIYCVITVILQSNFFFSSCFSVQALQTSAALLCLSFPHKLSVTNIHEDQTI